MGSNEPRRRFIGMLGFDAGPNLASPDPGYTAQTGQAGHEVIQVGSTQLGINHGATQRDSGTPTGHRGPFDGTAPPAQNDGQVRFKKRTAAGNLSPSERPPRRLRDGDSPPFRHGDEAVVTDARSATFHNAETKGPPRRPSEPSSQEALRNETSQSTGSRTSSDARLRMSQGGAARGGTPRAQEAVPNPARGGNGRPPPTEPAAMRRAATSRDPRLRGPTFNTSPAAVPLTAGETGGPKRARAASPHAASQPSASVSAPAHTAPNTRIPIIPASALVPVPAPRGPESLAMPVKCEFCGEVFAKYRPAIDHMLYSHLLSVTGGAVIQALQYLRAGAAYDPAHVKHTVPQSGSSVQDQVHFPVNGSPVAALQKMVAPVAGSAPEGRYIHCIRCPARFAPPAPNQIDDAIMHALYTHVESVARGAIAQAESHLQPVSQ